MAIAGTAVGISALLSAYQGETQRRTAKKALRAQQQGEKDVAAAASASQTRAEMDQRRANQQEPDVAGLLAEEQQNALRGSQSTMLTGPGNRSKLGGPKTMLG